MDQGPKCKNPKPTNFLEENIGEIFHDLELGKDFLYMIPKA